MPKPLATFFQNTFGRLKLIVKCSQMEVILGYQYKVITHCSCHIQSIIWYTVMSVTRIEQNSVKLSKSDQKQDTQREREQNFADAQHLNIAC